MTGQCGTISMIGEFSGWAGDYIMENEPGQPNVYHAYICVSRLDDPFQDGIIEMKFRQDQSWEINWGNNLFPEGIAYQNGMNIPVPYGCYDVTFNCSTGYYNFDLDSSGVSIIGEFNGWSEDVFMVRDSAGSDHFTAEVIFNIGVDPNLDGYVEIKFRENADWTNNWGGTTFPSGTGILNGPTLPVPYGNWLVSFDRETLDYYFDIGSGTNEPSLQPNAISVYPNPTTTSAKFKVQSSKLQWVQLKVYSSQGMEMANIAEGYIDAGVTELDFDATGIAPGMYFFTFCAGNRVTSGKLMISH
jgi:hypothetical protein